MPDYPLSEALPLYTTLRSSESMGLDDIPFRDANSGAVKTDCRWIPDAR